MCGERKCKSFAQLTTDWGGTVFSGVTLKLYYQKRTCDIPMPDYVANVLSKFQHDNPKHPQHTPSKYATPVYGAKSQYATKDSVLYYPIAVDPTVCMPLNDIPPSKPKQQRKHKQQKISSWIIWLLIWTQQSGIMRPSWYFTSTVMCHTCQCPMPTAGWGGSFVKTNEDTLNGSILNVSAVIKYVVASAA
jgi:hypothetical protein